jgi:hypothetical protein
MFFGIADNRIVAAAVLTSLVWFSTFRKKSLTPPGPPGWPLIGNMFDLPRKESWKIYLGWSKKYSKSISFLSVPGRSSCVTTESDIVSMKIAGTQFLILNSAKAIQDLLIKRSNIYSDR